MATHAKDPPIWSAGTSYEEYVKEIKVWKLLKSATAEEEGPLLFRVLKGEAKTAARELTLEQIGSANGLQLILDKLDARYATDKNEKICMALEAFEKFKRPSSMTINTFILEFERLHTQVKQFNCTYPDPAMAYKILQAANLTPEKENLVKATINTGEWKFDIMKAQIKKVTSNYCSNQTTDDAPVKLEPVLYSRKSENQYYSDQSDFDADEEVSEDENNRHSKFYDSRTDTQENTYFGKSRDYRRSNWQKPNSKYFRPQSNNFQNYQQRQKTYDPRSQQHQQFPQGRKYINVNINKLKDSYSNSPNVPNPKDDRGLYTTCRKCRSIYHWFQDCPHAQNQGNNSQNSNAYYGNDVTNEEVHISLLQSTVQTSTDEVLCLVGETLDHAVIDSGCTKTVCGEKWFQAYLDSMSEHQKESLKFEESAAVFRFGDSAPVPSTKKVHLPVTIKNQNHYLLTEVVNADIPLLISKDTMIKAKAQHDYENETITLFGVKQPLICTSSGHYAIPIKPHNTEWHSNMVFHITNDNLDFTKAAKKLHTQLGHASTERIIKLVKDAGKNDPKFLEEIDKVGQNCDICKRYKKTPPRPSVTFPLAQVFNETVAMDLKVYNHNNNIYFLHVIDHATRYSAASVIRSKKAEVIVSQFFKIWIAVFGCPLKVLSDNGGEFANQMFLDMCDNLNITFLTTAAEAPWSNGLVEKHNEVLGATVCKILEDINCSLDIALAWAVNAKNTLHNIHGFSSHQLVFGCNPNLPTVLSDKLPALEGVTQSQCIADHLNSLHKARQEFIRLESSERLRRALRSKVRTHNNIRYFQGEEVFYKREGEKTWRGSGKVIGQDGSKVLVKIPTGLISVHSSRVQLTSKAARDRENGDNQVKDLVKETDSLNSPSNDPNISVNENSNLPVIVDDNNDAQQPLNNIVERDVELRDTAAVNNATPNEVRSSATDIPTEEQFDQTAPLVDLDIGSDAEIQLDVIAQENPEEQNPQNETRTENRSLDLPRKHQCVDIKTNQHPDWRRLQVLGRGGKASGKHRNWINVRDINTGEEDCIDWKNGVLDWKHVEENIFLTSSEKLGYENAMQVELDKWQKMNVYQIIDNEGQPYISVRWVLSEKLVDGDKVKKARLVARGYEEDTEGVACDSPTVSKDSLRLAYMIMASKQWEVNSLDIKAAFLQGEPINRDIYIKPPREAKMTGKLWKLQQYVYGLNDASRNFYFTIKNELIALGCKCSTLDPTIFTYFDLNHLCGFVMSYVDDFLWGGTLKFEQSIIVQLKNKFTISSENNSIFKYLGIDIQQQKEGINISQNKYASEIKEIVIDPNRIDKLHHPINEAEKTSMRSVIGKLNWLSGQTRPDLAYDVCDLSTSLQSGTVELLRKANKVVKKAKSEGVSLHFPRLDLDDLSITCYADASFGNLKDGGSQGGIYIELNSHGKSCPVAWQSRRIRRAAGNTMAAETIALVEAVDYAIYISHLISEILFNKTKTIPVHAVTDNQSLYQSAKSTTSIKDKRLRIEMAILRESLLKKDITLSWIDSANQLADCLTKKACDSRKLLAKLTGLTK